MVDPYEGKAFVAYIDLHAFKFLMSRKEGAWSELEKFYETGSYWLYKSAQIKLPALFFSDSAVIWVDYKQGLEGFKEFLVTLQLICWSLVNNNLLPVCSIAFGDFKYGGTKRVGTTEQFPIYGRAFLEAYKATESGENWSGICKLVPTAADPYPSTVGKWLDSKTDQFVIQQYENSYIFYWMLTDDKQVPEFKDRLQSLDEQIEKMRYNKKINLLKESMHESDRIELLRSLQDVQE